jgi:hypothetical protein
MNEETIIVSDPSDEQAGTHIKVSISTYENILY